jgi:hypothetical protein
MKFGHIGVLIAVFAMIGCSPKSPEESAGVSGPVLQHGFTLTQQEFDALAPETQFMVANKALSTMYRGLPADEFFDLSQGLDTPVIQQTRFIEDLQVSLHEPLSGTSAAEYQKRINGVDDDPATVDVDESFSARFSLDDDHPHQKIMAKIQTYPVSYDLFVNWMSYFLANTIMFSPAVEMDAPDKDDTTRVLNYLKSRIYKDDSVRDIISGWLGNPSRWRVSRSPENHALEMFELYLGKFNDTAEDQLNTLNGGIVCSEYNLTDESNGYELIPVEDFIPETVRVFDKYITYCDELYSLVAGHPLLMPRVTEVIVNYFLDGSTSEAKASLINDVLATGPESFKDIFLAIIFSEEFLLRSERPKTFEENTFGFLHSMHWSPRANSGNLDERIIDVMLDSSSNSSTMAVHNMGWAAMDYKIGRTPFLPLDVLSFATYHKGIRESVLLQNRAFDGRSHPTEKSFTEDAANPRQPPFPIYDGAFYKAGTEDLKESLEALTASEFVDFVFLNALGRKALSEEKSAFLVEAGQDNRDYIRLDDDGVLQLRRSGSGDTLYEYWTDDFAEIMLDYISRLPEFYYFKAAN